MVKLGDQLQKAYVCLCPASRAVYLELTGGLEDVPSFYDVSFRRFSARRGIPKVLISDNVQTFPLCG